MSLTFLSKSAKYQIGAIKEKTLPLADGTRQLLEPGYIVQFRRMRALQPWEEDLARATFQFRGTNTTEDEVTLIDPVLQRVSVFETGWVPEEIRDRVEKILLEHPQRGHDFVLAERPKLTPPWPRYDDLTAQGRRTVEMVAEKIVEKVRDDGYDPVQVAEYERQTLNRPEVLEALERLANPEAEPVVEVTA